MINNLTVDCSISLIFGMESDHVTYDLPQTFRLKAFKSQGHSMTKCRRKCDRSPINSPRIVRFRSNFVQSLSHVTAAVLQTFKVDCQQVKDTT